MIFNVSTGGVCPMLQTTYFKLQSMTTNRLEAFSDGVLAIVITIMVLELKIPEGNDLEALTSIAPVFITYILSFIYLGIYWNNHHHLMHMASRVNGKVLWANLHLLFWLSLLPFATGFMGENHFQPIPTAVYGTVLLMASIAWTILGFALSKLEHDSSPLKRNRYLWRKSLFSISAYLVATLLSLVSPVLGCVIYVLIAIAWFVPIKAFENNPHGD